MKWKNLGQNTGHAHRHTHSGVYRVAPQLKTRHQKRKSFTLKMRTEKEYCISEFAQDFLRSDLIGQAFLLYYYTFFPLLNFSLLILKCYTEF